MEGPAPSVPLERLLAHREWVRRLARSLVADENLADDLEQGVWLEAIEKPPRSDQSLRGWLATVLRNNLLDFRRAEGQRRRREEARTAPWQAASAADLVAEAEAHRKVVVAVMELAEPYRSTVLFRFFEGLDSSGIALRTGVPTGTVRTRLARALAMLRESLSTGGGANRDSCRLALLPLAEGADRPALPSGAGASAVLAGGMLMNSMTKVAVATALLVTGGLSWWALRPGTPDSTEVARSVASRPARPPEPNVATAPPAPRTEEEPPVSPVEAAAERPSDAKDSPAAPARIGRDRLPRLAGVAPLPPEKERIDIEVDERGGVTVGGMVLRMEDLRRLLQERADSAREESDPKASLLNAVLRVDRDLPWQGAQCLMQACAHPEIRIYKIQFAALSEDGTTEGAIPTFLPKDRGRAGEAPDAVPAKINVKLSYEDTGAPVTPGELVSYLEARLQGLSRENLTVEIDAAPSVPTGDVLGAVDAAVRWGAKEVVFRGTKIVRTDYLDQAVAMVPTRTGFLAITVLGKRVEPR